MSWVAQLMVYPSGLDMEDADGTEPERYFFESEMNRFFESRDETRPVSIEDARLPANWYSGGKSFGHLYVGAYNFFPLQEFLDFLQAIVWENPESADFINVQVIVGGDVEQDGMDFRVIKITYESETAENNA